MQQTNTQFLDPEQVFEQVSLELGWQCADFGCGGGHFTFEMSRRVGEGGRVFAFDILPEALEAIESHSKVENLQNISTKRVNLEKLGGSGLEDNQLDFVVLKDILFQNTNKKVVLEEARRILKERGKALIIEWSPDNTTIGPEASLRIPHEKLENLIRETGFTLEKRIDVGEYHQAYLMSN